MNNVAGNYNVKSNYQQLTFKGGDREYIRKALTKQLKKSVIKAPFDVAMFNIKLGIVKGLKKVVNIFKK